MHAELSPSASKRWKSCKGSVRRSRGISSPSNPASRKGTAKHFVSALCLEKNTNPSDYIDRKVVFVSEIDDPQTERECFAEDAGAAVIVNAEFAVDQEFVEHCELYVNYVREYVKTQGGDLYVEQRLSIEHITGEAGAKGTTDALVVGSRLMTVIDAKFGVSKVNAYEGDDPNSQLAIYCDAALVEHELFGDFDNVRLVIVQPAINHISEHFMSVPKLKAFIQTIREAAEDTRKPDAPFNPTSDNCYFCPARMTCEARAEFVLSAVLDDFNVIKPVRPTDLGDLYPLVGLIREWCTDVETRVKDELTAGRPVKGFKLVTGNQGDRKWTDVEAVTAMLREMRLKDEQMFSMKLIGPAGAEKLTKARKARGAEETEKAPIGPIRWAKLQQFIERAPGKPEVAPESDPRPVHSKPVDDFEIVSELF